MPGFERGDLVRVPFPYTDRNTRQNRPALVVSAGPIGGETGFLWVLMVTSAENRAWPGDVALGDDYAAYGLPAPSVVRTAKIATIEARHADVVGRLPKKTLAAVEARMRAILGFAAEL